MNTLNKIKLKGLKSLATGQTAIPDNSQVTQQEAEEAVRTLLKWAGEDANRNGLLKTPERVASAFLEIFSGYKENPEALLATTFDEVGDYNEMVLVKEIPLISTCEHHMLPIVGKAHVAYIPDGRVVGLSKIPRLVEIFARRLQIQEKLTCQIAETLQESLQPLGVAVAIEATHYCMAMRGVKQDCPTLTYKFTGNFSQDIEKRREFKQAIS
jgi:GTP cyclohydrolase I